MSRANATDSGMDTATQRQAIASFLRGLAARVEQDATFAEQVRAALRESGLLATDGDVAPLVDDAAKPAAKRTAKAVRARGAGEEAPPLDPFTQLRERGEPALRGALETLELSALRQIVRVHRLDPARISARWSARDRVINLIVEQVRARANHGKAFARV